jgi:hypothetical protein
VEGLGLFVEEEDARHFEHLIWITSEKHRVSVYAYALGPNSAMLVVKTPDANLSAFLQGVQTAFARHIRHHYVQQGPIMQGRYHAKVLQPGACVARACEWVHTFPVREEELGTKAQRKAFLTRYPFSSFRASAGLEEPSVSDPATWLRAYGSPAAQRARKHMQACEELLENGNPSFEQMLTESSLAVGSPDFLKEMARKHQALQQGKRVAGLKVYGRKSKGVARNKVKKAVAEHLQVSPQEFGKQRHSSMLRPVLAYALYRHAAMTQREIADFIGVGSSAAVSLQMKRLLQARAKDPQLDHIVRRLEADLSS